MPNKPDRPCRYPGCPNLTSDKSGYCESHLKEQRQRYDSQRGTAAERGYDARWQRYRLSYLAEHPLCVLCTRNGRVTAATVVDHIKPHHGDPALFWDTENHQSLCKEHHDIKTATEDGAFGNPTPVD